MHKLYIVVIMIFFFACKEEVKDPISNVEEEEKLVIDTITSDAEFIYFENEERQYYYPTEYYLENFSNKYLEESDQLNINMKASNDLYQCNIYINAADIFHRTLPYTVAHDGGGSAEIQLRNHSIDVPSTFGPEDSVNYVGSTIWHEITMTITSLNDSIITLSFEGNLATKTGKMILVQNGKAKIFLQE